MRTISLLQSLVFLCLSWSFHFALGDTATLTVDVDSDQKYATISNAAYDIQLTPKGA